MKQISESGRKAIFLMLLPSMILVGIFLLFPAIWVLYIGMTNETLTGIHAINPQFIGLKNFLRVFKDKFFIIH